MITTDNATTTRQDMSRSAEGLPTKISLLLALTYLASALLLPFMLSGKELPSMIAACISCALTVAISFASAKKPSRAFFFAILVCFIGYSVGSPMLPALLFGLTTAIASASALLCSANKSSRILLICAAVIAYPIAYFVTFDPTVSLFALALIVPSLLSAVSTHKKAGATTTVALTGIAIVLVAILVLIYRMQVLFGEISIASLSLAMDSFVNFFVYYVKKAMVEVYATEITETVQREIVATAESCVNLAIGFVSAAALTAAYFCHRIRRKIFIAYGIDIYLTPETTRITVSATAALVFIVSYVLSFATSAAGSISIAAVVGNNVCLILMPCLLLKGLEALKALPFKLGFFGLLIAAGLIAFMISVAASLPMLLALIGAFFVLIVSVDAWAKGFYGKGEGK